MHKFIRVFALGLAFAVVGSPLSATSAATGIPRMGDRIPILWEPTATFPAGEPFNVRHGFGVDNASDSSVAAIVDYDFDLFVDGVEVRGPMEVIASGGEWESILWIFNFPQGLETGDHVFKGVWTSPDAATLEIERVVEFVA